MKLWHIFVLPIIYFVFRVIGAILMFIMTFLYQHFGVTDSVFEKMFMSIGY